jgi:hypothetical protein
MPSFRLIRFKVQAEMNLVDLASKASSKSRETGFGRP